MTVPEPYDVIVLGGGTAGVVAAIQAGRAGARTLLVEKTGMLGGSMTNGGVNNPGLFFAGTRQVIAGIGWELVTRCLAEAAQELPVAVRAPAEPFWQRHVPVDRFLLPLLLDEMVAEVGVDILLHSMVAAVTPVTGQSGWQVTLCTKSGLETRTCAVLIDCTGDATGAALAGLPLEIPDEVQPATLCCRATGYDLAQLDISAINRAFQAEVEAGRLRYTDVSFADGAPDVGRWLATKGENCNHLLCGNARDSEGKTRLELAARRQLLELHRFLRRQPGLERLRFEYVPPECGVRETVTIRGKARVTLDDYTSGRVWDDAVCYACYPIDLHIATGRGTDVRLLPEGTIPTVPRGALLPEGSRNFLVAGRCLSSDRLANSALRVQATCMATGQAAGALAALASSEGGDPETVPLAKLDELLRRHGAIEPKRDAKEGRHP
jgi:hypothetical protein